MHGALTVLPPGDDSVIAPSAPPRQLSDAGLSNAPQFVQAWTTRTGPHRLALAVAFLTPAAVVVTLVIVLSLPLRIAVPGLAIVVTLVLRPSAATALRLALVAIPFTAVLRRVTAGETAFVTSDPLAMLAVIALIPALGSLLRPPVAPRPLGRTLYRAYLGWLCLSFVLGSEGSPATRTTGFLLVVVPAGTGYLVATGRIPGAEQMAYRSLLFLPSLVAAYGVWQFFRPPRWDLAWLTSVREELTSVGVPEPRGFRIWSTLESPLTAALYLGLGLLAYLVRVVCTRTTNRKSLLLLLVPAAALAVALLLTSVRTVLFALPVLLLLLVIANLLPGGRSYGALFAVLLSAGISLGVGTLGLAPNGTDASRFSVSSLVQDQSVQDRTDLLPQFLDAAANPVGSGAGTAGLAQRLTPGGQAIGVDNGYLSLALEGGVVRLALFLALAVIALVACVRWARTHPSSPGALLGVLVVPYYLLLDASSDATSGAASIFFWVLLGSALQHGATLPRRGPAHAPGGTAPRGGWVRRRTAGGATVEADQVAASVAAAMRDEEPAPA